MNLENKKTARFFQDERYCICCGERNPWGFKMSFRFVDERVLSEVIIPKEFQGFSNVVHGGVGVLLDEMMVNLHWLKGIKVVTAEYQVRLKAPCPVHQKIHLSAWSLEKRRKIYMTAAEAHLDDGTQVAEAQAKCMVFD